MIQKQTRKKARFDNKSFDFKEVSLSQDYYFLKFRIHFFVSIIEV